MTTTSRRKFHLSLSGLSIAFALGLALWEWYFFFVVATYPLERFADRLGFFTPNRFGLNLAWLTAAYLTYQLISIPFALPAAKGRFIGVVDGLASLVPLAVVLVRLPEPGRPMVHVVCANTGLTQAKTTSALCVIGAGWLWTARDSTDAITRV